MYEYDANAITEEPIKNITSTETFRAYLKNPNIQLPGYSGQKCTGLTMDLQDS